MQYVLNCIQKEIERLQEEKYSNDEELNFLSKEYIGFNTNDLVNAVNTISKSKFLLAAIRSNDKEIDFNVLTDLVLYLEEEIDNANSDSFIYLLNLIKEINDYNRIKDLFNILKITEETDDTLLETKKLFKDIFKTPYKCQNFLNLFYKYKDNDSFALLEKYIKLIDIINDKKYQDIAPYLLKLDHKSLDKQIYKKLKKANNELDYYVSKVDFINKINKFKDFLDTNDMKTILGSYSHVEKGTKERIEVLKEEKRKLEFKRNKEVSAYRNIYQLLSSKNDIGKILIDNKQLEYISNKKLVTEIILYVLNENKNEYNKLLNDYLINEKTEYIELDELLSKYDIKIDNTNYKSKILEKYDLNQVKELLTELNNPIFNDIKKNEKIITEALLFSDKETIIKVVSSIKENILTKDFFNDNIGILYKKSDELNKYNETLDNPIIPLFDTINKNINLLSKNGIVLTNIKKYNINLFIMNNNNLKINLDIINSYLLNLNDNNLINLSILENISKIEIIDKYIELGLFNYLNNNINIINQDESITKKIYISNLIDMDITDSQGTLLPSITEKSKFYINDDELDNYIENDVINHIDINCLNILINNNDYIINNEIYSNSTILKFDKEYKTNNNEYNFDGIIISRNKFIRNMSILDNYKDEIDEDKRIISSLLYNSTLEENKVKTILTTIQEKKVLKKEINFN